MENDEPARNKASLRIHSEITSGDEISKILKFEPDKTIVKGTRAVHNNPKSYVYPAHMWRLESDIDETEPLDMHISRLADFVEDREAAFKELIKTCEVDIFCGYFPNGWTGHLAFSPDLMKRLTIIPITLLIELYPPTSEDEL